MDYYPWEKLSSAVTSLVGPEPIEERLRGASVSLLSLNRKPFDNTEDRQRYEAIMERLVTDVPPEDRFSAMSRDEARSLATAISALYESIVRAQARDALHS